MCGVAPQIFFLISAILTYPLHLLFERDVIKHAVEGFDHGELQHPFIVTPPLIPVFDFLVHYPTCFGVGRFRRRRIDENESQVRDHFGESRDTDVARQAKR